MSKLKGKVAVVTGGSSGIGLAIARRFVEEGAHVVITGRRQEELDKARSLLGDDVTAVRGDASSEDDLDALYARIRSMRDRIDIVVANAGMLEARPLATATPDHFDKSFDLNVRGVFFTVQKALPILADGGSVVLVASAMHSKGLPGHGVYSATKAAVRSFARTWAAELKERGIRVNSLSPGGIETPMLVSGTSSKDEAEKLVATYGTWIPLGRVGRPEEIASAALFLASSESSYLTGSDLVVDGGFTQV
ncbi:MAG: 3-oxoacyl-[acyl-carrier protein] reductase [Labilithrix sp.]|jgi:NAD(P)-dependent dehydrogenase (short-subunit alcohol dehydrogenase family)|nr:3-oxoacyl-[acyl-carrier protein] reductase [Labilithrix sp.]